MLLRLLWRPHARPLGSIAKPSWRKTVAAQRPTTKSAVSITYTRVGPKSEQHVHSPSLRYDRTVSREEALKAADDFKNRSCIGQTTIEDATRCLGINQQYLKHLELNVAREKCQELALGGHVLYWMWHHFPAENKDLPVDSNLVTLLCWFLLPENREQYVWDWLTIMAKNSNDSGVSPRAPRQSRGISWTKIIPASLADAHFAWAQGGCPDGALRCYKTAHQLFASRSSSWYNTVRLMSMAMTIDPRLKRTSCPPSDARLFESFLNCMVQSEPRLEAERARLKLYHPSQPDAGTFCRLFQAHHPELSEGLFQRIRMQSQDKLAFDILRASYILRLQHAESDALWLDSIVESNNARAWDFRHIYRKQLEKDPKLDTLRTSMRSSTSPSTESHDRK